MAIIIFQNTLQLLTKVRGLLLKTLTYHNTRYGVQQSWRPNYPLLCQQGFISALLQPFSVVCKTSMTRLLRIQGNGYQFLDPCVVCPHKNIPCTRTCVLSIYFWFCKRIIHLVIGLIQIYMPYNHVLLLSEKY